MGKREKIAAAVLLAIGLLSFFISVRNFYHQLTVPAAAFGGTYTEGVLGQPVYINPLLARSEPDISLTKLIFSGLYKYDNNGQLIADLADGLPTVSEDQKQYTINLKREAKWQNDKPVTADDVIFTIQLLKDPAYKSPLRPLWQATSVEKLNDYSVKFTTKDVSGPFLDNLTLGILPKGIWKNVEPQNFLLSKNNLEAVGSGPYAIREIKKMPSGKIQQITFQSNPAFYPKAANIDRLVINFYDTEEDILNAFHSREIGGFGFIPLGSSLYVEKDQNRANVFTVPLPQYQVVFFNLNHKILNDPNVRRALTLATDKQQIITDVFKGNALLPASPLLFAKDQEHVEVKADLEQAAKLLDSDGWKVDQASGARMKSKAPLELTIATNDSQVNSKAAEILADQWRKLGLKINLKVLASKDLMDSVIKPRSFDVLLFPQRFGADPDPFIFWHSSQVKDPGYNLTGFSDPAADKLIIDARATTDKKVREEKYKQFSDIIASKAAVIFLDQTEYIYAVDKNVKNINTKAIYEPSQRFYDISNWYIAEQRNFK